MLDNFYITIYSYYHKSIGKHSITIAALYINLVYASLFWALAVFALVFAQQMNVPVMSNSKFLVLYGIGVLVLSFKNWMYYTGKKRLILKSKFKGKPHSVILLWALPVASFTIGFFLYKLL